MDGEWGALIDDRHEKRDIILFWMSANYFFPKSRKVEFSQLSYNFWSCSFHKIQRDLIIKKLFKRHIFEKLGLSSMLSSKPNFKIFIVVVCIMMLRRQYNNFFLKLETSSSIILNFWTKVKNVLRGNINFNLSYKHAKSII